MSLREASQQGNLDAVKRLLDIGADLNSKDNSGRTPLSWAAWGGREAVVKLLLDNDGVDPDSKDNSGQTPLSWAAREGREAVVKLLLDNDGVDPDSKDSGGRTPLLWAIWGGREAVVKLLHDNDDVDPDSKDNSSRTPLLWAAQHGSEAVVKLLLNKNGVDPDSKDNSGRTPLSWAAREGREAVVKLLLDNDGVDPDSKDNNDRTPLSWAAQKGHKAVVQLLLEEDSINLNFNNVTQGEFGWFAQLKDEGLEADEIMPLVIQAAAQNGPWTPSDCDIQLPEDKIDVELHQSFCAHKLRQRHASKPNDGPDPDQPMEHFDRRDMERRVSLFCGLAGVLPPRSWSSNDLGLAKFTDQTASIIFSDDLDTSGLRTESLTKLVSQLHEAARGVTFAAVSLQQTKFCCNQFTVLTAHENGSPENISVVRMNTIPFHLVVGLTQEIATLQQEGLSDSALSRSVSASSRIIENLFGTALSHPSTTEHKLHLCSLTVQLLSLSLIFYSQAHTGDFHPVYLAKPLKEVLLRGISPDYPFIVAERCELACMGEMVGGKVFVFRISSQILPASTGNFHLDATCEAIVDSWGPGSLILDHRESSAEKIFGLIIRGSIIRPGRRLDSGYRLCHWGEDFGEPHPTFVDTFSYRERLIVGATAARGPAILEMSEDNCGEHRDRHEGHTKCDALDAGQGLTVRKAMSVGDGELAERAQTQQQGHQQAGEPAQAGVHPHPQEALVPLDTHGSVTINNECPRNILASRKASQSHLSELGTGPSCWKFVERSTVFQFGDKILGQVGCTQAKQPGVPRKRAILDRWTTEGKLSLFEEPWGLQVSLCTGVARRVPLRVLVRDDLMDYIDSLRIPGWQQLREEARVAMVSKQKFAVWSRQLDTEPWECMQKVFDKLLKRLKDTGFDKNGLQFSTLWPSGSDAIYCVKVPPKDDQEWCTILKDEEWSATFAVATNLCLEASSYRCRNMLAAVWSGAKMLSTFVLPNFSGLVPSTVESLPGMTWRIEHHEWYWNGEVGGKVRFLARKVSNAVTELEFHRSRFHLVPRGVWSLLPPHYVLVERSDVDFGGEEVFILPPK